MDLLIFAAHPDDAELACAGTIAKQISLGNTVGIIDLTEGELGTRGSVAIRYQEAKEAAEIMGVKVRENLQIADGKFENSFENQLKVIKAIRKYQPKIVITNALHDRHPDHGRAQKLVTEACFLAGLAKIETPDLAPHRPQLVYNYIQDRYIKPDFVVDISGFWDIKEKAIRAYKTQFYDPSGEAPSTYISSPQFLEYVKARAKEFGHQIGVEYAEGYTVERVPAVKNLFDLI